MPFGNISDEISMVPTIVVAVKPDLERIFICHRGPLV